MTASTYANKIALGRNVVTPFLQKLRLLCPDFVTSLVSPDLNSPLFFSDLSMDIQHSTAPLMRQLESMERKNRARATAWAEVKTKLRSDLEDNVIQLEKVTKDRNNLISSKKRLQRLLREMEEEIASSRE